jgi:hypothetical protein
LPSEKPRLQLGIRRVLDALKCLLSKIEDVASHVNVPQPIDTPSVELVLAGCHRVCDAPCPNRVQVDSPRWLTEREQLDKSLNAGRVLTKRRL